MTSRAQSQSDREGKIAMTDEQNIKAGDVGQGCPAYFTVEATSTTIRRSGAIAIYAGDVPRKNDDGTTSHSLRGPLLLMPPEMWNGPDEIMQKVADALNKNAHLFFDSAKLDPVREAAPDLLAMLKVAQLWLDVDGRYDMQGINAAIARAEGRS